MTNVRGPKTGRLTAVFRGRGSVPVPGQRSGVVDLGSRAGGRPDPRHAEHTRLHQAFLGRVIDYLSADAGVRQFVDWGCPVPGTAERVHATAPDASVVHVAPHGAAGMLSTPGARVLSGDGSGTDTLLRRLGTSGLVDFDEPVAVLMTRPFTADDPPARIDALHALMRGGGYLALTSPAPRAAVERAFDPFQPIEPGVADLRWWPYPDEDVSDPGTGVLAGLGRAPRRRGGVRGWR
ncbi:SAM-dependent methyltransferase [Nocardiopsis dassonvillei]|uniref:SAM-dependent methyltransferase n=1 Tax=Nocardiopsis dassonvillei TaxID=2014 RepID=UPI0010F1435C|nr:SAM-dependent methyltransferase [Nocardiopsis dassonvillei]MCP3016730.1 SAM-dependent methyltransferase [Nocardiopsis dassonvillei]